MESINVVVDDDEVERPSSSEENPLNSAASYDIIKPSPNGSSSSTILESAPTSAEDEDTPSNPPRQSRVRHNHTPQQLLGNLDEGRILRSIVIQPANEVANQVSYSCYLT